MKTTFKTCVTLLALLIGNLSFGQSLYEDFSTFALPSGWTQTSVSLNDVWHFGGALDFGATAPINDPDGNFTEYARIDFSTDPDTTALVTPARSIAGIPNPEFSFYYISQTNSTNFSPYNRLVVQYWNGGGWADVVVVDTLTTTGWVKYTYNATLFTYATDSVRFRFAAQEGGAAIGGTGTATFDQDMAIDNVLIGEQCNPTTGVDAQMACNTFTWIDGNTYTSSNSTATHTLTNAAGCDSVVTLNLTITNSTTGVDAQIACDTFTWIDGNTYTSSNSTATHTLTNAAGCDSVVTLSLTINPIMASASVTDVLCNGDSTGIATISTTGGFGTLTIDWGGMNPNMLAVGTFTYTVTDTNNCMLTDSVAVGEPAALSLTTDSVINVTCNGASNGVILATITGGTMPYTYLWSNGNTTLDISGLSANFYTGTVTDANGCEVVTSTITITEPTVVVATTMDNNNGSATASATGGTVAGAYNFLWDVNAGNQTTATATGLTVGTTYCVTITDDNNCSDTACVSIITNVKTIANKTSIFNIYPNPTTGKVFVNIATESTEGVQLDVYNTTGQNVLSNQLPSQATRFELNMSELPEGIYILRFAVENEVTTKKLILHD